MSSMICWTCTEQLLLKEGVDLGLNYGARFGTSVAFVGKVGGGPRQAVAGDVPHSVPEDRCATDAGWSAEAPLQSRVDLLVQHGKRQGQSVKT